MFQDKFAIVGRAVTVATGLIVAAIGAWLFLTFVGIATLPMLAFDTRTLAELFAQIRSGARIESAGVVAALALVVTGGIALAIRGARPAARVTHLPWPAGEAGAPAGDVTVTDASICALVHHAVEEVVGVHTTATRVRLRESGWRADLDVRLDADASVPAVVEQIRSKLAATLEHQTGRSLRDLRVHTKLEPHVLRGRARAH